MTKLGILSNIILAYPPPQPQSSPPPPTPFQPQQPAGGPPPPPPPPPAGAKKGKPWLLPFVFAIIAVIFLILALIGPWQSGTSKTEIGGEEMTLEGDMGLQSRTARADEKVLIEPGSDPANPKFVDEYTANYNDKPEDGGMNDDVDEGGRPNELGAWNVCFYLTILAFIMAILMLVFTLVAGTKRSAKMGKLAMIFAILALIFGLLTPIYAVVGVPAGRQADFDESIEDWDPAYGEEPELEHNSWWESYDEDDEFGKTEVNVGAGWGWYLALIGGIMALLGMIFIMKMNKKLKEESPAAPLPPPPPAPAPPPPQQPPQW
ncbi:MAG: hypothetical protein KAJ51_12840 [Thermoplasmata archaeon]|nr:hypothetical protein [Thermoplasmata archaeon]